MKRSKPVASEWARYQRPDGSFDFEALTPEQKERFYRHCEETDSQAGAPLTPAQRRLHERARRRGRPRKGAGARIVSLSVERELLDTADALARRQGLSRSELFARGLRAVLVATGAD